MRPIRRHRTDTHSGAPRRSVLMLAVLALVAAGELRAAPITREYQIEITDVLPPFPGLSPEGLEECMGFGDACVVIQPVGVIRLTTDAMTGLASLDLSGVSANPILTVPPIPSGAGVIDLFFSLQDVNGIFEAAGGLHDLWAFEPGGVGDPRVIVSVLLDGLQITGGYDLRLIDGPSALIALNAVVVPEPSTALLICLGLAAIAARPVRHT